MEPVTEVVPGVYQLKVPIPNNPLGFTLPYLLKGSQGTMLIDTGVPALPAREALQEQLRSLIDPTELLILAITHSHPDHSGLAGVVKYLAPEVKIAIHETDWEDMRRFWRPDGGQGRDQMLREMTSWAVQHGFPEENARQAAGRMRGPRHIDHGDEAEGVRSVDRPDILLKGGERLSNGTFSLEAIHTPGHSPGHLCYYEEAKKVMFTGDHVLPVITSHVGIRPGTVGSPLEEYISSLDKIADREVDMVCPAHEYVFNDLKGRIQALHRHHEARLEAVVGAIGDGSKTGYEIAEGVPWDVGSWEEMDIWLRRSALGETLSHLELLVSQGRVRRSQDVSPVRFEVART